MDQNTKPANQGGNGGNRNKHHRRKPFYIKKKNEGENNNQEARLDAVQSAEPSVKESVEPHNENKPQGGERGENRHNNNHRRDRNRNRRNRDRKHNDGTENAKNAENVFLTESEEEVDQIQSDEELRIADDANKRLTAFTEVMLVRTYKSFWTEWVSLGEGTHELENDLAEFYEKLKAKVAEAE
jgi:hypothetical protein